jgi:hypothetical protein
LAAVRNYFASIFRSQASWLCSFIEFNTTFTSASVRILALQFVLLLVHLQEMLLSFITLLQEFNECHLHSKDLKNIALAVYHERRKELPELSKTRAEVHETLSNISVLTNKEENIFPMND